MKAVYIENYGGRAQLKYGDLPQPKLGEHDVLIEAHAASVNPVDWKIREGYVIKIVQYEFPLILGWDVAGVIVQIGSKVTRFQVGDEVFSRPAIHRNGTYAEYVAVDESLVAFKPANISFIAAASVPLAGLTAWEALVVTAHVMPGQRVLVHAGAGGVGIYAIQLAKALGAYVATTTSARHTEFVRSYGADEIIDYNKQDFSQELSDYDMVFDTIGVDSQAKSFQVLRTGGILVSIVSQPDATRAEARGVQAAYFFLQPDGEKLAKLGQFLTDERIRPVVGTVFPLQQTAKAHELSESHHAEGKIVLSIR